MSNTDLAAILAKNNADEQHAIEGYYKVLAMQGLPQELYKDLKEIISDEMNHSEVLSRWVTRLTNVSPNAT